MEQINELIKKVEELSEEKLELKTIEEVQSNISGLKEVFKAIFDKSKETQDFINQLDLAKIVEGSMEDLQDEFYDRFIPPMKFLKSLTKKIDEPKFKSELEDLRKQLQRRIIDAQSVFHGIIGKNPYKLEQMESLQTIRKKLIPELEKQTDFLNKNVDGIEDEIYEELSNNYKSLLDILRNLKLEIEATNKKLEDNKKEVEKLASTSAWIKEQLAEREKELEKKDAEAGKIKAQLVEKEKELIGTIEKTKESMESTVEAIQETERTKIQLQEDLIQKNEEIERMKVELESQKTVVFEKEKEIEKLKSEQIQESGEDVEKIKTELNELLSFLEKSPKYQLLFLINNEEEIPLDRIEELLKFDNVIIRSLLDELSEKKLINIKGKGEDMTVSIVQKLNPLSCIEFKTLFENKMLIELKKQTNLKATESYFDICIDQINKHKQINKEEAGFLLSLLYLYIYDSKKFEFFSKIRDLYGELKPHSFYLRLVENALTYDPWESKKNAILGNLMEFPQLNILNSKFEEITENNEDYPKDGPFYLEKFESISLIDWENEGEIRKSNFNQYSRLIDLAKWVWLNVKGSNFRVELKNSKGKSYSILISTSKKIKELMITKHQELIAE